jgi:hypothetical protein
MLILRPVEGQSRGNLRVEAMLLLPHKVCWLDWRELAPASAADLAEVGREAILRMCGACACAGCTLEHLLARRAESDHPGLRAG